MDYPTFETRSEAEAYREHLYMQGYERSMGYEVLIDRCSEGYEVVIRKVRAAA